MNHENNRKILKEDIWNSYSNYYIKDMTNPKNKMFINEASYYSNIKGILKLILVNINLLI